MKKIVFCLLFCSSVFALKAHGVDVNKLQNAWKKSEESRATNLNNYVLKGKPNVPYYSLSLPNGVSLPGERPWDVRWNIIKRAGIQFNNKKIVEFGCNMGLLSTFLCYEFNPQRVVGFDRDEVIVECAKLVAEAFNVAPAFYNFKLGTGEKGSESGWADLLGYDNDIVFLLSVFKYFSASSQDAIMEFLVQNNYPVLVYEGDKYLDAELNKFRSAGYNQVRKIGVSERNRPMFVVSKG